MDVDLSTDLAALLPLVAPLLSGHSDLAIGTRLAPSSRVRRGRRRELISRTYNRMLHGMLGARFSDAQCGFKAIRADVAGWLVPQVRDDAGSSTPSCSSSRSVRGCGSTRCPSTGSTTRIPASDVLRTALADLRGIARLMASARHLRRPLDPRRPITGGGHPTTPTTSH